MYQDDITRAYGAARVALKPIRDGQGGASVLEARLDGQRYALRVSGPFLSARPHWIEFEGELLALAGRQGVSVAGAVLGVDGRYGQPFGDRVALLTEWAEGDIEWPTPPEKARLLGGVVARLHLATQDLGSVDAQRPFDTD